MPKKARRYPSSWRDEDLVFSLIRESAGNYTLWARRGVYARSCDIRRRAPLEDRGDYFFCGCGNNTKTPWMYDDVWSCLLECAVGDAVRHLKKKMSRLR